MCSPGCTEGLELSQAPGQPPAGVGPVVPAAAQLAWPWTGCGCLGVAVDSGPGADLEATYLQGQGMWLGRQEGPGFLTRWAQALPSGTVGPL